jgi:hypothetical protein
LDRKEATTMLLELIDSHLVDPTCIDIKLRKPEHYQVQIESNYDTEEIKEYAEKHNLAIEQDKEQKYLFIYKP